jgi:hypothetical protein
MTGVKERMVMRGMRERGEKRRWCKMTALSEKGGERAEERYV